MTSGHTTRVPTNHIKSSDVNLAMWGNSQLIHIGTYHISRYVRYQLVVEMAVSNTFKDSFVTIYEIQLI